jgi:antirestriction protein ArdC
VNIYENITNKIVEAIEKGLDDFQMPWHRKSHMPRNGITGTEYAGINVLILWAASIEHSYDKALWATYRQWNEINAQVKKGEKSTSIIFYQKLENEDDADKPNFVLRSYSVFNVSQVLGVEDNITPSSSPRRKDDIDAWISSTGVHIVHGGDMACYVPKADLIRMPHLTSFIGTNCSSPIDSYYSILFHELTHWSGHESRLKRDLTNRFGSQNYAIEELIAEFGSAFLCARIGLSQEPRADHAKYIQSWLKALKSDHKALFICASKAKIACEYLLDKN